MTTIAFSDAVTRNVITTLQTEQLLVWINSMASLRDLAPEYAGAEQVATICHRIIKQDFRATERQWERVQSAYWTSTDGYGRLVPARLSLIIGY